MNINVVDNVPVEILTKIFKEFMAISSIDRRGHVPCLSLLHVCRKWRQLATAHPELLLQVTMTPGDPDHYQKRDLVKGWALVSAFWQSRRHLDRPIDLSMDMGDCTGGEEGAKTGYEMADVIRMFAPDLRTYWESGPAACFAAIHYSATRYNTLTHLRVNIDFLLLLKRQRKDELGESSERPVSFPNLRLLSLTSQLASDNEVGVVLKVFIAPILSELYIFFKEANIVDFNALMKGIKKYKDLESLTVRGQLTFPATKPVVAHQKIKKLVVLHPIEFWHETVPPIAAILDEARFPSLVDLSLTKLTEEMASQFTTLNYPIKSAKAE